MVGARRFQTAFCPLVAPSATDYTALRTTHVWAALRHRQQTQPSPEFVFRRIFFCSAISEELSASFRVRQVEHES